VLVSKLIVFEVRVNGAENVNAFSFVVNNVVEVALILFIDVV
jgi:hypothetical protein